MAQKSIFDYLVSPTFKTKALEIMRNTVKGYAQAIYPKDPQFFCDWVDGQRRGVERFFKFDTNNEGKRVVRIVSQDVVKGFFDEYLKKSVK